MMLRRWNFTFVLLALAGMPSMVSAEPAAPAKTAAEKPAGWKVKVQDYAKGVAVDVAVPAPRPRSSSALNSCYRPPELGERPDEYRPAKGIHKFDAPIKIDSLQPAAAVDPALRGAIRRVDVPNGQKVIALTFDLCEQRGEIAGYDGRIIDYLRQQGVKATLFVGGKWMVSHPERIRQLMLDPQFEIANHSETHRNLRLLTPAVARQEILAPEQAYQNARTGLAGDQCIANVASGVSDLPERPHLFRFPYGACNDASLAAVNDAGLLAIQWDVSTGDPDPHQSAAAVANAMVKRTKPGSIVVSHANGRGWHTAEALPLAIPKLKAAGYKFVTVSELLSMGKPVIAQTCFDSRPGDTNRYDFVGAFRNRITPSAVVASNASGEAKPAKAPKLKAKPASHEAPPVDGAN